MPMQIQTKATLPTVRVGSSLATEVPMPFWKTALIKQTSDVRYHKEYKMIVLRAVHGEIHLLLPCGHALLPSVDPNSS